VGDSRFVTQRDTEKTQRDTEKINHGDTEDIERHRDIIKKLKIKEHRGRDAPGENTEALWNSVLLC
jgi:uncharacterized Zn finger protein